MKLRAAKRKGQIVVLMAVVLPVFVGAVLLGADFAVF